MDDEALCGLVQLGRETRDLDYKGPAAWDPSDKTSCCALVKDILALANFRGGSIVIGVEETATGFLTTGLTPDQLESWESTKVNNFVQNYATPAINIEVAKPACGEAQFAILLVPQFRQTPHICIKEFPGVLTKPTLYVRTANNASEPISATQDLQDLVERAIRTRQDQMLEAMREILTGSAIAPQPPAIERFEDQIAAVRTTFVDSFPEQGYDGYLTTEMFPAQFEPQRFSIRELRQAAAAASVTRRGWPFIYYADEDQNLAVMNDGLHYRLATREAFGTDMDYQWDLKQSGLLVQRMLLLEEAPTIRERHGRVVDPNTLTFYVAEGIDALVQLYAALDVTNEDITLRITVEGAEARSLAVVWGSRLPLPSGYTARESVIRVEGVHPLADWQAGLRDLATEMTFEILKRFQVTGGFSIRDWVDKLLDRRL